MMAGSSKLFTRPARGTPVTSVPPLNHLFANSHVFFDTCVFAKDNSTPSLSITDIYLLATLSLYMTMSSPSSIYCVNG